jgi:site-specific recombinase XerD
MTPLGPKFSKDQDIDRELANSDLRRTACHPTGNYFFFGRSVKCNQSCLSAGKLGADRIAINCTGPHKDHFCAINCNLKGQIIQGLSTPVRDFIFNSIADNTKRAYAADMAHFAASARHIPSTPEAVAEYLAEMAGVYAVSTIQRRLASISKAHRVLGVDDPGKSELVKTTIRGIRRTYGLAQREATALLRDDLFAVLDRLGTRPKDVRDRALLLLGFATAMRRSELAGLDVGDVEFATKGMLVTLRRSKTDQEAQGRKIAVPLGRTRHCPVTTLKAWLDFAEITNGAIFRTVDKHGHIADCRISGEVVSHVLKSRIADAGYDPSAFSGHSLRAGFATSAAQAGASTYKIRQTTGHRSEASLVRYIRDTDLFTDNAAARVL